MWSYLYSHVALLHFYIVFFQFLILDEVTKNVRKKKENRVKLSTLRKNKTYRNPKKFKQQTRKLYCTTLNKLDRKLGLKLELGFIFRVLAQTCFFRAVYRFLSRIFQPCITSGFSLNKKI